MKSVASLPINLSSNLSSGNSTLAQRLAKHWLTVPLLLILLSTLFVWVDLPVARFFATSPFPGAVRDVIDLSEVFGHGAGVVYLLIAIYLLDEGRRRVIPRIAACSLGAGIVADIIKLMVARTRPRAADLLAESPFDTFGGFLPLSANGANLHSFPSAHTSVAFGLAVAMSVYYPKGRGLFFLLNAATMP
jgi:hypothetical protein